MAHGYELCNVDQVSGRDPNIPFSQVDLTDFGQTMAALSAIDERVHKVTGIVHLGNADTVMLRDNKGLLAEVFPDIPQRAPFGPSDSLFSIEKAWQLLKYEPKYSWRTHQPK